MSSTCLSSATIVRCNALSRTETTGIFIPPVLQLILSIVLVASRWGSGKRKHFLLAGEGFVFFILTLLDLLSHQLDSARNSVNTFKVFDILIGVLSFIPILLYTAFLYTLTRSSFIPFIPRRFQRVATYTLLGFIPIMLATNEVGSFVGITYLMLQDILGNRVLAIGFRGTGDQAVWQFFNSVTLAMLLTFQAVVFFLSFYHFMKPFVSRNFAKDAEGELKPQPYLHKGIGWISLGVKLGSIETLLGFVDGHYNIIIARRVLRLVSRACMIIAVLTGLDGFEDFRHTTGGLRKRRPTMKSTDLRGMISNPRNSTFTRLSPNATTFYGMPRAANNDFNTIKSFASEEAYKARMQHRVTVRYDNKGKVPPTLNLRLSDLNIPDPEVLTATYNKRGTLVGNGDVDLDGVDDVEGDDKDAMRRLQMRGHDSIYALTFPDAVATKTFKYSSQSRGPVDLVRSKSAVSRSSSKGSRGQGLPSSVRRNNSVGSTASRVLRHTSAESSATDTLDVVHHFANQFPGIPPRITRFTNFSMDGVVMIGEGYNAPVTQASSLVRSNSGANPFADPSGGLSRQGSNGSTTKATVGSGEKGKSSASLVSSGSVKRKAVPVPPPIDALIARPNVQVQITGGTTNTNDSSSWYAHEYIRRGSDSSEASADTSTNMRERDPFAPGSDLDTPSTGLGAIARRVAELERRRAATKQQKSDAEVDPFQENPGASSSEITRIKSIGRVSSRQTPTPSASDFVRQSLVIEQGLIAKGNQAKVQSLRPPVGLQR